MGWAWAGHGQGGAHVEYEEAESAVTLVRSLRALAIMHAMALRTEMGFRASGFPRDPGKGAARADFRTARAADVQVFATVTCRSKYM